MVEILSKGIKTMRSEECLITFTCLKCGTVVSMTHYEWNDLAIAKGIIQGITDCTYIDESDFLDKFMKCCGNPDYKKEKVE